MRRTKERSKRAWWQGGGTHGATCLVVWTRWWWLMTQGPRAGLSSGAGSRWRGGQLHHRGEFLDASKGSPCMGQPQSLTVCRCGGGGRKEHEPTEMEHFAHGAGKRWGCGPASPRSGRKPAGALCPRPRGWALSTGAGGPLGARQSVPHMCPRKGTNASYSIVRSLRPSPHCLSDCGCSQTLVPAPHPRPAHTAHSVAHGCPRWHPPARVCSVVTVFPSCWWGGGCPP